MQLHNLTGSKLKADQNSFNPKKLLENTVSLLETEVNRKCLHVYLKLIHQDITVNGDEERLSQALLNLLAYIIKLTPANGEVTLGLRQFELDQEQAAEHIVLQFTAESTGKEIAAEQQAKFSHRFFQVSSKDDSEHHNANLELTTSKDLIESMGGKLETQSQKLHGTKFTFSIPCKNVVKQQRRPSVSEPVPTKQESAPMVTPGLEILIVDDYIINQILLRKQLEKAGYRCHVASTGQEAVEIFKQNPVAMVLMDIKMPTLEGLETTKTLRSLEKDEGWQRSPVPIIGQSGYIRQEHIEKALHCGMNDYLAKPYEKEQLLGKITHHIKDVPPQAVSPAPSMKKL